MEIKKIQSLKIDHLQKFSSLKLAKNLVQYNKDSEVLSQNSQGYSDHVSVPLSQAQPWNPKHSLVISGLNGPKTGPGT